MSAPSVLLVGLNGYGLAHAGRAVALHRQGALRLVAGVDLAPESIAADHPLRTVDARLHRSLDKALAEHRPDLVVIATPIHLHAEQALAALASGASVLLEKPLCASLADAARLQQAAASSPGFLAVGFQLSYSPGMRRLKADILAGRLGAPRRFAAACLWPRDRAYYLRNAWAGKVATPDGRPVLDSPHNNATSHFLFNLLWLLGRAEDEAARPRSLRAALGRAARIEAPDTAMIELEDDNGTPIRFVTSHSVAAERGPCYRLEFEDAEVVWDDGLPLRARLRDGRIIDYSQLGDLGLETCLRALRGEDRIPCGVRAAARHTAVVVAAQRTPLHDAPPERVWFDPRTGLAVVEGLEARLLSTLFEQALPEIDWLPLSHAVRVRGTSRDAEAG